MDFPALVQAARAGDRASLEALVRAIQDDVYGLAVRMLWDPDEAADATQEVLVQVVTNLASWRGEASFRTWALRIATHSLLRARAKRPQLLEPLAEDDGPPAAAEATAEHALLAKEVRLSCSLGLLQVLDLDQRLAYVLGEVLGLTSDEAAEVTGIEPAAHRKRLSRAREKLHGVLDRHCGVVNPAARCRCERRTGHVKAVRFATAKTRVTPSVWRAAERLADAHAAHDLYRSHPDYAAPEHLLAALKSLLSPEP